MSETEALKGLLRKPLKWTGSWRAEIRAWAFKMALMICWRSLSKYLEVENRVSAEKPDGAEAKEPYKAEDLCGAEGPCRVENSYRAGGSSSLSDLLEVIEVDLKDIISPKSKSEIRPLHGRLCFWMKIMLQKKKKIKWKVKQLSKRAG